MWFFLPCLGPVYNLLESNYQGNDEIHVLFSEKRLKKILTS